MHRVVRPAQAILHLSGVRSQAAMLAKTRTWGHAGELDWSADVLTWMDRGAHPLRTARPDCSPGIPTTGCGSCGWPAHRMPRRARDGLTS